jgi:hypothetical protein
VSSRRKLRSTCHHRDGMLLRARPQGRTHRHPRLGTGSRDCGTNRVTKPEVEAPASMQLALRDGSGSAAARCIRYEGKETTHSEIALRIVIRHSDFVIPADSRLFAKVP